MSRHVFECIAVPGIRSLDPYQPGKPVSELERELGLQNIIKLASNENPLGPSPKVIEAIRSSVDDITRYPDGNGFRLKRALASHLQVNQDQITLGNGSNDVLELIARSFLSSKREAVYSQHAFAIYPLVVKAVGAKGVEVPAADGSAGQRYGHDLESMAEHITENCRVVYIANPNNPTGTYNTAIELKDFLESVPNFVVVVVDEAYFEYVEKQDYPNALDLLECYPNLVITRTFSKAYGLAGLRLGYAISNPEIANLLNRIRQPFNVNSLALASAEVALSDQNYITRSKLGNSRGLIQLSAGFEKMGLDYIPSVGNFVCFDCNDDAMVVYEKMLERGIIVRPIANYGLPRHLRVTVGTEAENIRFLAALEIALQHD